MSETVKHTPGPWKVFIDDSGDEFTGWPLSITAPSVHEDCMVVRTGGKWPYEWDHRVSQAEAIANARLIAAAPEMLDSGRKLANEVGGLVAFENEIRAAIGNTNWSVLMQRLAEAEAAISKAKVEGRDNG